MCLQSISATGGRRLLQQNQTYPAADIGLNISTSNAQAGNQAATLRDASNKTYALASAIGAQGVPLPPPSTPRGCRVPVLGDQMQQESLGQDRKGSSPHSCSGWSSDL